MSTEHGLEVNVYGSNSVSGSNLQNYSDYYEEWDSEEGETCQQCYGTGLDRDEVYECATCYGEGIIVRP